MISPATTVRRHDSTTIGEARRLAELGGWSAYKIAKILTGRGIPVSESTVRRWIDERASELDRGRGRARMRRQRVAERAGKGCWFRPDATVEYRMARLASLAATGVSVAAVAKVMTVDFGDPLTEKEVRQVLATGRPPLKWRQTGEGER